ncbi:polysaccharide deacetylase family protein [Brevundimonas goettingensis]|uniref:DUF4163 domain-containing protein n=1 Tax=Brevundimonas goettingensis TaxID=2774190 RepID=A0A975C589_9CAUL|nr:hypothetical protein [Brevundimonas goettingensis]QTC91506.1 hypothetical protein IFJ75_00790 [Brevundimonas goettingensis]
MQMRRGWALLAVALLAVGCHQTPVPEGNVVSDAQEPWPLPPVVFRTKMDQVELGLWIDPAIQRYPTLHDDLKSDAIARLKRFGAESITERREGEMTDRAPFDMGVSWAMAGETPRLASVEGYESQYQGGNHPNHWSHSVFWDRVQGRKIAQEALFRPGSGEALRELLCRRLLSEYQRRDAYMRGESLAEFAHFNCGWGEAELSFVLAPAAYGQKAAGVVYLLAQGQGGGYAAGAFRIFVPTAALRPLLADAYADQFSENPRRP